MMATILLMVVVVVRVVTGDLRFTGALCALLLLRQSWTKAMPPLLPRQGWLLIGGWLLH